MARGRREQWQAVVERWKASGFMTKEFCREAGVNYWTFSEWRRKLEPQRRRNEFVEVVDERGAEPHRSGSEDPLDDR